MAGLGLMNALGAFQQGRAWRENQDAKAAEAEKQKQMAGADTAARDYMAEQQKTHEQSQAKALEDWTATKGSADGFQAQPWRPDDRAMMGALTARGDALLKAGNFDAYAENRARLVPVQLQARRSAWDAYQTDGDVAKLGASIYNTIPDGKTVSGFDMMDGAGPDGKKAPAKIRYTLSDGSVRVLDPVKIVDSAKRFIQDPETVAKLEFERDLLSAKQRFEEGKAAAQGEQARKTEGLKSANMMTLEGYRADRTDTRAAADRASAERRTGMSTAATRYSADQGLAAAKTRTDSDKPKQYSDKDIMEGVTNRFGKLAIGAFGGKRNVTDQTNELTYAVREILNANPGADLTTAIRAAAKLKGVRVAGASADGEE